MRSTFLSKALQQQSKLATFFKVRFNPTYTKMVLVVQGNTWGRFFFMVSLRTFLFGICPISVFLHMLPKRLQFFPNLSWWVAKKIFELNWLWASKIRNKICLVSKSWKFFLASTNPKNRSLSSKTLTFSKHPP